MISKAFTSARFQCSGRT